MEKTELAVWFILIVGVGSWLWLTKAYLDRQCKKRKRKELYRRAESIGRARLP